MKVLGSLNRGLTSFLLDLFLLVYSKYPFPNHYYFLVSTPFYYLFSFKSSCSLSSSRPVMSARRHDFLTAMVDHGYFFIKASDVPSGFRRLYYLVVAPKGIVAAPPDETECIARRLIDFLAKGGVFYGVEVLTSDHSSRPFTKTCFDLDYGSYEKSGNDMIDTNLADATHLLSVLFTTCSVCTNDASVSQDSRDPACDTYTRSTSAVSDRAGLDSCPGPIFLLCKADTGVHLVSPNVCMTTADMKRVTERAMCSTSAYRPTLDLPTPYDTQIYGARGGSLRGLSAYKRAGGKDYYKPIYRWSLLTGTWAPVVLHRGRIAEADYLHACLLISPECSGLVSIAMRYDMEGKMKDSTPATHARKRARAESTATAACAASAGSSVLFANSLTEQMEVTIWAELKDTLMTYGLRIGQRYSQLECTEFQLRARVQDLHTTGVMYLCPGGRARKLCPLLASKRSTPEHKSNGGYFVLSKRHGPGLRVIYTLAHICHDETCRQLRKQNTAVANSTLREVSPDFYVACLDTFIQTHHLL